MKMCPLGPWGAITENSVREMSEIWAKKKINNKREGMREIEFNEKNIQRMTWTKLK